MAIHFLSALSNSKMSREELFENFEKSSRGDLDARENIIRAYLPLVVKLSRKYAVGKGISYEDLFQEGCYGLFVALQRFDYTRGTSFAIYASFYIKKYIKAALVEQNTWNPIVYSQDMFYEIRRYLNMYDQLSEQLNRNPTDQELIRSLHTTANQIKQLRFHMYSYISFQACEDAEQFLPLPKEMTPSVEDVILKNIFDVSQLGISLTKREEEVVSRRLGFTSSGKPESTNKIAADLGLSCETVRTTYVHGIQKIQDAALTRGSLA